MATTNGTLASALLAFQSEAPALQKDKINPHFRSKYLSLESLMEQVLPVLNSHGLVLIQQPGFVDTAVGTEAHRLVPSLTTTLLHGASGESRESTMLLMAAKDDPQGQASAVTYARRISAMSMLGLVADEDDDGNRAQPKRQPDRKARAASTPAAAPAPAPEPTPTPEAADKGTGDAGDASDDPARTATLVGVAEAIIGEIQRDFGDHPDGMPWADRMTEKCQEWFGHGTDKLTTAEATTLVQRLRATKAKLLSDSQAA